jgi:hypothetical protein
MTTRNCRIRFMEDNFAMKPTITTDYSSQTSATYAFTNALNNYRTQIWQTSGYFLMDATNNLLYINDGGDKTATITAAEYTTPALLATEIQTQLNSVSANWTVTYSTTTNKFNISNSGSVTVRYSQTTNAIWDVIGHTLSADTTGTTFNAQEPRIHTEEFAHFDLGFAANIRFFAAICPLDENFAISEAATIKLMGNNIDNLWDSPQYEATLTRSDEGIFHFLDATDDTKYRYWKFQWIDRLNSNGSSIFEIGNIYLGDYVTISNRNVARGFGQQLTDRSRSFGSESGVLYFDEKTKYSEFTAMNIGLLDQSDKDYLRDVWYKVGLTEPFYISVDPTTAITADQDELTKYVYFSRVPSFRHIHSSVFSTSFNVREAI